MSRRTHGSLRIAWIAACMCVVQFVACVYLAIGHHKSEFNPLVDFLSELGTTRRNQNPWLFNGSLAILGTGLLIFIIKLRRLSQGARNGQAECGL